MAAAPEVEAVAPWALVFGTFSGELAEVAGPLVFAGVDERFLHDTNRPIVVDGAADNAALEQTVTEVIAPGTPVLDLNETARRVVRCWWRRHWGAPYR